MLLRPAVLFAGTHSLMLLSWCPPGWSAGPGRPGLSVQQTA
jgi:hypothetical protein